MGACLLNISFLHVDYFELLLNELLFSSLQVQTHKNVQHFNKGEIEEAHVSFLQKNLTLKILVLDFTLTLTQKQYYYNIFIPNYFNCKITFEPLKIWNYVKNLF